LPEELLKLSVADLGREIPAARLRGVPPCWEPGGDPEERRKRRYQVEFNPVTYLLALEKLVTDSGVTLLYDTRVCAVASDGDMLSHAVVENKSGRSAVACRTVVDATGDADVCHLSGEQTESLDTNVLSGWFTYIDGEGCKLNQLSNPYSPVATRDGGRPPFFRGDNDAEVTAQVVGSRDLIRQRLADIRSGDPDGNVLLTGVPTLPCFRMTRRLVGSFSLGERHVHQWFEDAIGFIGDWRKAGPVYAVPWRTLLGVRRRNLVTAGRCISADTTVWDVTRAIPGCALTGAAAGVGAALAAGQHAGDLHALHVAQLQESLRQAGCLLDPKLVEPAEAGE
jgi:hypothetical protein